MTTERPALDTGSTAPRSFPGSARTLLLFFLLTYAVMWACFITVAAAVPLSTLPGTVLILLGTYSPSLVALALTARAEGSAGVRALLDRVFQARVALRWYLFALLYLASIKLTAAVLLRVTTGAWPRFGQEPWFTIPFAIAFSTPFQAGEEIGWRGYALPRLAARFGLARASLLLGLIWGVWHLPQFYIRGADTLGQSFFVYLLQVTALSVAFAWLWARSQGSLLPVMLLHAAVNNSKDIVPSSTPGASSIFTLSASPVAWITVALQWAVAAIFLVWMARTESRRAGTYG